MTGPPARRHAAAVVLCLIVTALLILLAVRHAQALHRLGFGFDLQPRDIVVFAIAVALLAAAAGLLDRVHRHGLSGRGTAAVAGAAAVLLGLVVAMGDPDDVGYAHLEVVGDGGFLGTGPMSRAYSSSLVLYFDAQLPWPTSTVLVAALGLLPVAAAAAALGAGGRVRRTPLLRAAALVACVVSGLLLLAELERAVALLDVLRGEAQQLGALEALTWVGGLWALVALAWCARALLRSGPDVSRLALLVPAGVLLGSALLLLDDRPRHDCCFAYAAPEPVDGLVPEDGGRPIAEPAPYDVSVEVAPESQVYAVEDTYYPPPLGSDLLLLAGCLAVGVALPLGLRALQLRRVSTSASTPPG